MPVVVDECNAQTLTVALQEADEGCREVLIRGGEHCFGPGPGCSYTPQNEIHIRSDGGGARLVAPNGNGSVRMLQLGSLSPLGPATPIGMAVERSYFLYAPGHSLVAGDYVLISDGSSHTQVSLLLDVRGPYLYPAETLVHTWNGTWTPGGAWVYKLSLMPGLQIEGLDFDIGANGGADSRGLLVGGCINGNFHDLHSRGFGSGQGFMGTQGGIGFGYQYGSTFTNISGDRDGSDGNWGFGISDSANIDVSIVRSGVAQGFAIEYVRVHHSQFSRHRVSSSSARGIKWAGCSNNQWSDMKVERAGALNTSWYTGFAVTGGCHDNWGRGISVQGSIESGIWFDGTGNHHNHLTDCLSIGNAIGSGFDVWIPQGDNFNHVEGRFGTVANNGVGNVINNSPV